MMNKRKQMESGNDTSEQHSAVTMQRAATSSNQMDETQYTNNNNE